MKKRIHIAVDKDLYDYVKTESAKQGYSVSYFINRLLLDNKLKSTKKD